MANYNPPKQHLKKSDLKKREEKKAYYEAKKYPQKEQKQSGPSYHHKMDYAKALMERNSNNKNINDEQHNFLKTLSEYRHLLHCQQSQYFFNTARTAEIDNFFATLHSMDYFERMNLPYPKDIISIFNNLQSHKNMQFENFDDAVMQYAYTNEALNMQIEKYLRNVDDEKGTKYAPSGNYRESTIDPVETTIRKLKKSKDKISPYQEKILRKLDKVEAKYERKGYNPEP